MTPSAPAVVTLVVPFGKVGSETVVELNGIALVVLSCCVVTTGVGVGAALAFGCAGRLVAGVDAVGGVAPALGLSG